MKTSNLVLTASKFFVEGKTQYKIIAKVSLNDDCKNGIYDFSVTADTYQKKLNGQFYNVSGGCQHEEILKHFPDYYKMFVSLHLCNHYGQPMYPVANGFYHMKNSSKEVCMDYLRISENEYKLLKIAEDEKYFKYLLFKSGIVKRWNKEAKQAILKLQELTGNEWENPYKEGERFYLTQTEGEKEEIELLKKAGYYSIDQIIARKNEALNEKRKKERAAICEQHDKKIKEEENTKQIKLYIFDSGLSVDNVIYYNHRNEVVFNWMESSYITNVTEEEFNNFISKVDYSKLPEGIKFTLKK